MSSIYTDINGYEGFLKGLKELVPKTKDEVQRKKDYLLVVKSTDQEGDPLESHIRFDRGQFFRKYHYGNDQGHYIDEEPSNEKEYRTHTFEIVRMDNSVTYEPIQEYYRRPKNPEQIKVLKQFSIFTTTQGK